MLFCFDVDGTLLCKEMEGMGQYVEGVVKTDTLLKLLSEGHAIAIVSPSPYYPHEFREFVFSKFGSNEYRWRNVDDAMTAFGKKSEETIYVDDLAANRHQLEGWGVKTLSPEEFNKEYE